MQGPLQKEFAMHGFTKKKIENKNLGSMSFLQGISQAHFPGDYLQILV